MILEIRLRADAEQDILDAAIVIIAVMHGSRNPQRWKGRA